MEKINFVNNQTPASAGTMNTFQDNIENAINETIAKSEWIMLNNNYGCYYRKSGNIIEFNMMASSKELQFGKNIVLGILDEGYRPSKRIRNFVYNRSGSTATPRNVYIEIQPGGNVYIFNWDTTDTFESLSVNLTYIS